jgi:quinol monooxygenase YgiN
MIVVMGTLTVRPEAMAAVREAMRAMMTATLREAGCLSYNLCEDLLEPGRVRVSEEWETMAALDAHLETDHMKTWRAALGEAGVGGRKVSIYEGTVVRTI